MYLAKYLIYFQLGALFCITQNNGAIFLLVIDQLWRGISPSSQLLHAELMDYKTETPLFPIEGLIALIILISSGLGEQQVAIVFTTGLMISNAIQLLNNKWFKKKIHKKNI